MSPQWSADGRELAHMRREEQGNVIEVITLATRDSRRLPVPGEPGNRLDMSWSADGRFFAYIRAANRQLELNRLWVMRVSDGEAFPVTDGTTGEWSPCGRRTAASSTSCRTVVAAWTCGNSDSRPPGRRMATRVR